MSEAGDGGYEAERGGSQSERIQTAREQSIQIRIPSAHKKNTAGLIFYSHLVNKNAFCGF